MFSDSCLLFKICFCFVGCYLTLKKSFQVTEKEGFTWKGHSALTVRSNEIKMASGYQPSCVVQVEFKFKKVLNFFWTNI